jgi:hypothetical protein
VAVVGRWDRWIDLVFRALDDPVQERHKMSVVCRVVFFDPLPCGCQTAFGFLRLIWFVLPALRVFRVLVSLLNDELSCHKIAISRNARSIPIV